MVSSKQSAGARDLAREVRQWQRLEKENRELNERVASALGEINHFIAEQHSELERRKGRLLQTNAFKDETRVMETALASIQALLAGGRNISRIFAEIDKYLNTYAVDDTLSRLHTHVQLADARDDFMCAFHDSIRGTRLSELLDILYFMPFAYWRSRGLVTRNYRSPSSAEVLKVLADLEGRRIDFNRMDTVELGAVIRIQLGITPRMDYHTMSANKLAEQLTDGATLTKFTAKVMPLDEGFCRAAEGILGNIRRWSAEFFASAGWLAPAEIEAEMLHVVYLAGDTLRISGTEKERATDFLWLLSTVIASGHTALKDILSWPSVRNSSSASVHERILGTKTYLDRIAVLVDKILAARWVEAKAELHSLASRSEVISSRATHEFDEFADLEQLKEKRSDIGKSLIKIADSLQLIEPALLDMLTISGDPATSPSLTGHVRTLSPATLIDRNRACAEETKQIARQELDKLRALIERMATISRKGFAFSAAQEALDRQRVADKPARKTSAGVEIGRIPVAEVQALLACALRNAVASVQDFRSKIEGARKRTLKSDVLHALNVLNDRLKKTGDGCGKIAATAVDSAAATSAAEIMAPLLREIMSAQTNFSTRLNNTKLTPAEKQPLTTMVYAMKSKLNDDLRDIEGLRAELAERAAQTEIASPGDADHATAEVTAARIETGSGAGPPRGEVGIPPVAEAVSEMTRLASAANGALRPVKEKMARLSVKFPDQSWDNQAILEASRDLMSGIAAARQLMIESRSGIESIAAAASVTSDEYVERIVRWRCQLEAADDEAELLLKATGCVAAIEESAKIAAALEAELSAEDAPSTVGGATAEELYSKCARCSEALQAIADAFKQLREARQVCAAAAKAEWRLLKGAPAFIERNAAALEARETALKQSRSWIADLLTILCS